MKPVRSRASSGPSEDQIQIALVEWMRLAHPKVAPWMHHSPNGGHRSPVTGARLKALGVRRGFPDLTLWLPRGGFHGLAIELKAAKGKPTTEQIDWLNHMGSIGWLAVCCTGFDAARQTIEDYLRGA